MGIASSIRGSDLIEAKDIKIKEGDEVIAVDPRYFRPTEVETLLGDPTKAREKLGWEPQISFQELVNEMVMADFELARKDYMCKMAGFKIYDYNE